MSYVTPTIRAKQRGQLMHIRLRKVLASLCLVVGVVALGTAGVQWVFEGDARGATGTILGVLLIVVGIQQWIRVRALTTPSNDVPDQTAGP
jgi:hypothetical protein